MDILMVGAGGFGLFLVGKAAHGFARAKRRKLDLRSQKVILEATAPRTGVPITAAADIDHAKSEHALSQPLAMEVTVTGPSKWERFQRPVVRGVSFPDGSVVALSVEDGGGPKGAKIRLARDTEISAGGVDHDRCCVGLLRLAGVKAPVRLPHAIAFDTSGKAARPTAKVTAEAVISYDGGGHRHTTRRVTILGFEPVGEHRRTDEVFLHAWCWQANGYRTFRLSRITALTDAATGQAANKIDWVWEKGGLHFPPSAELLATN